MFLGRTRPGSTTRAGCSCPRSTATMAGGLVVTRGQERCLFIFPMDEFVKVAEQMRQAPTSSRKARDYSRVFLSGASDEVPDKQGRFTIPAKLREYAGLDREVTVIGAGSRLEVWDSVAWRRLPRGDGAELQTEGGGIPGLF